MSQEESEHNEDDGMKKGVDSKGEVMHSLLCCEAVRSAILATVLASCSNPDE